MSISAEVNGFHDTNISAPQSGATPATTTNSKRKRSEGAGDRPHTRATVKVDQDASAQAQKVIEDLWVVLKSNDTAPSTLDRISSTQLPPPVKNEDKTPASKRIKLTTTTTSLSETLQAKLEKKTHTSADEFVSDFEAACTRVLQDVTSSSEGTQWKYVPGDLEHDKLIANVASLRKLLKSLTKRHAASTAAMAATQPVDGVLKTVKKEEDSPEGSRTVLTLFGNAQGHKQLFSSFQQPAGGADPEPVMPLRENGLPNGIMSTQIVPLSREDAAAGLRKHTFADVFGPPANLTAVGPFLKSQMKSHKAPSSNIVWGSARERQASRPLGHSYQKMTAGQWLGYNGIESSSSTAAASEIDVNEDALFRSVYSSFAPSRDNTGAIYPDDIKDNVWWQKIGRQMFEESLNSSVHEDEAVLNDQAEPDMEELKQAVDNFDPALLAEDIALQRKEAEERDLLEEISELLESLHSYQRIRHSRTIAVDDASNKNDVTSEEPPSDTEVETYNTLKAQLALVISILPPYAVARLNGDQLEDLNISTKIRTEEKNIRGVLEEDAGARAAKAAALSAALGNNRVAGLSTPGGGSRTASMAGGRSGAQYNTPANLLRQSSQLNNRQPLSGWQTPGPNLSATAPRPSYNNQQSYGSQSARPASYNNNLRAGPLGQFQNTAARQQPNTPLAGKSTYAGVGQTSFQGRPSYTGQAAQAPMTTFNSPQSTNQAGQFQQRSSYLSQPPQSASPAQMAGQAAGGSRPQTPAASNVPLGMTPVMGGAPTASMRGASGTPQPQ